MGEGRGSKGLYLGPVKGWWNYKGIILLQRNTSTQSFKGGFAYRLDYGGQSVLLDVSTENEGGE